MKTTWCATSRANSTSWVTISIVTPAVLRSLITLSTSPTSPGSSAEVTSSSNRTLGCVAHARAIATRCCWPPDSCAGNASPRSPSPTRPSQSCAVARASSFGRRRTWTSPSIDASEGRHVREQVEALEDHADLGALMGQRPLRKPASLPRSVAVSDQGAVDGHAAPAWNGFEKSCHAAQERRFARPGRPEHDEGLVALDVQVDAAEHLARAEALVDAFDFDHVGLPTARGTGSAAR